MYIFSAVKLGRFYVYMLYKVAFVTSGNPVNRTSFTYILFLDEAQTGNIRISP